jgi:hypothetical protein
MPPIFVIGPDGEAQIVNSRIYQHILIVDRLFGAAELRLGSGDRQQTVRIVRTDGRPHHDRHRNQPGNPPRCACAARAAARHPPVAQGARQRRRRRPGRHRRRADLRAPDPRSRQGGEELYSTDNRRPPMVSPACRATIPARSSGRRCPAISAARSCPRRMQGQPVVPPVVPTPGVDEAEQRRRAEEEAARTQHRVLPVAAGINGGDTPARCRALPASNAGTTGPADRAGQAARLPQCGRRPPHRHARSRHGAGIALRAPGRRGHLGRAHHRHPLRSSRPDHRAGHGEHLRQPDRAHPARAAGHADHRPV